MSGVILNDLLTDDPFYLNHTILLIKKFLAALNSKQYDNALTILVAAYNYQECKNGATTPDNILTLATIQFLQAFCFQCAGNIESAKIAVDKTREDISCIDPTSPKVNKFNELLGKFEETLL